MSNSVSHKKRMAQHNHVRYLCSLALLIAVELVMKLVGLGMVPIGPLKMSFLTVPVAVGAMLLGPGAGAVMGGVFGLISLQDAITGASVMTNYFFTHSPFLTIMLCVGMRVIMGFVTGVVFRALKKLTALHRHDESGVKRHAPIYVHYITALLASLLNTALFMGFIAVFFYNTEYVQNLASSLGATGPLMFIFLLVGVQGLIEAAACTVVAGTLSKVLEKTVKV